MRQRIEDLGRLTAMLDALRKNDIFDVCQGRAKHFADTFFELDRDSQEEMLTKVAYGLEELSNGVYECLEIAQGQDYLNENPADGAAYAFRVAEPQAD